RRRRRARRTPPRPARVPRRRPRGRHARRRGAGDPRARGHRVPGRGFVPGGGRSPHRRANPERGAGTLFFREPPTGVVQGVTGREASMIVRHMRGYGTAVAAGVTPGKGGLEVEGVRVYDTIGVAASACGGRFDAALVSVPPLAVLDAAEEAIGAGIRF